MRNSSLQYNKNIYNPFGLQHGSYNTPAQYYRPIGDAIEIETVDRNPYKYKYQGQERQDELGLNWDSFKWRNYDYAISRFISIDPLSEQYNWQSHYAFSENRVIDGVELEGLERVPANEVWDLGRSLVTASGVGNFDKNGSYKVTSINNNLVSMHLLTSGPNQGNWAGVEHTGGGIGNFFGAGQQSDGYSYEFKYVIGKDLVGSDRVVSISSGDIAYDGLFPALLNGGKFSKELLSVTLINSGHTHSFDSQTGELNSVPFNTIGDVINVAKDHFQHNHSLSDYLPSPKIKTSTKSPATPKTNPWHQFRAENKGKYTKENYGTSEEASRQRTADYIKWKETNGQ